MGNAQIVTILLLLLAVAAAFLMPRLLKMPVPRRKQLWEVLLFTVPVDREAHRYCNVVFGTFLVGAVISFIIVASVF